MSTPLEAQVVIVVAIIFGTTALFFTDAKDKIAVFVASAILLAVLFTNSTFASEWHYWLIGGALFLILILAIDSNRKEDV